MGPKIRIENIVKITTYLIGFIGFLSVSKHISAVYSLSFLSLYLFSVYFEQKKSFIIPRWVLNILSTGIILLTFLRLTLDDPVTPALEALVMLLAIKSLEQKRFRDYMQIYIISVFLLAGYSLMSIDILFLAYFLSMVFLISIVIVLLTYFSQDPDMELGKSEVLKIVTRAMMIPLVSVPVTVFMFVILPRTNYPFFNFLNRGEMAKTGFTDNVRLGGVTNIQADASTIFRANMDKVNDNFLYWRGIVLDSFDGTSWEPAEKNERDSQKKITLRGNITKQTIYLEPYGNSYLFALDKPAIILLRNVRTYDDLTFKLSRNIDKRIKYETSSVLSETIPDEVIDTDLYLQLPENLPPEIINLSKELSSRGDSTLTINAILKYLREGSYKYSLQNLPLTDTPLRDFLFRYKYGNCEYFASAMAVMLRASGIPARIVGGYKGGYYNNTGGYYLVLQKNAHVWVEAYVENNGWLRLDPTPSAMENYTLASRRGLLFRIRMLFDAIDYYWNVSIISYNLEKQVDLFQRLKEGIKRPQLDMKLPKKDFLIYISALLIIVPFVYVIYLLLAKKKSAEEKIIETFLERMKKYGYERHKSEGLEEFTARVRDNVLREKSQLFVKEFEVIFYKDKRLTIHDYTNLKKIIKEL